MKKTLVIKNRLCKCGCDKRIKIKYWHTKNNFPKFIRGHHIRIKNPSHNKEIARKRGLKLKGRIISEMTREKIRISHLGKPMNYTKKELIRRRKIMKTDNPMFKKENKLKISKSKKELWKNPTENMLKGIEKGRIKISGKNNINYKDGNGYAPYDTNFKISLKKQVKKRDKNICQLCNKKIENKTHNIHCHHINYNNKDSRIENLITLHLRCNHLVHKKSENRDFWFAYFCYLNNIEPEVLE